MSTRTISSMEARPAPFSSDSDSMSQWAETIIGRSSRDSQLRPGSIPMILTPVSCIRGERESIERVRIYRTKVLPHSTYIGAEEMILPELLDCSTYNTGKFAGITLSQIFPAFDTRMFQSENENQDVFMM